MTTDVVPQPISLAAEARELQRRRGWSDATLLYFLLEGNTRDDRIPIQIAVLSALRRAAELEDQDRSKIQPKLTRHPKVQKELPAFDTIPRPRL